MTAADAREVDYETCPHCRGEGRVPLGPEHQRTLDSLRDIGAGTAEMLAKRLGVAHTAMCNRLAFLLECGHVERVRQSVRVTVWRPRRRARKGAR